MGASMRPVLKYPGSKWNIAGKLSCLIPEHHSYVEPYFGSGALLFHKPASDMETVNDLDSEVVNLPVHPEGFGKALPPGGDNALLP